MRTIRPAIVAASTATALLGAVTTAVADPPEPAPVTYQSVLTGDSVVTTLTNGTFALSGDGSSVAVRDASGRSMDSLPTVASLDGRQFTIRQDISTDGRVLTSTPDAEAVARQEIHPIASPLENQLAMNDLINSVSIGTSVGSLVGTAVGAVIGIGVGVAMAGASCAVLSIGCVVTVLPIVSMVGAVGGLAGLVIGGGPTAAAALFEYVTVLRTAPGASKYAPQLQGKPGMPHNADEETR
ncbi:hypothetical protein ACFXPS_43970 [Nocardia sp. NPDC059091]|uniref:hypothetical protein n=1 Tax=unclassified Nocardia TaxID=2637762 RepID=UPI003691EBCA